MLNVEVGKLIFSEWGVVQPIFGLRKPETNPGHYSDLGTSLFSKYSHPY